MFNSEFAKLSIKKLVENLLSVKVWILILNFSIATFLCWHGKLTGTEWAASVGGVTSTIVGMREIFKVAKVKSNDDTTNMFV